MVEENNVLDSEIFELLKKKEPNFLRSYVVLAKFYEHITNDFSHKVWKDGRIVLTPIKKEHGDIENPAE